MTVVLGKRRDIDLDAFERVAWRGEDARIADEACRRMAASRASFLALLESDPDLVVYGTTSRAGEGARVRLTREEMEAQGREQWYGSSSWGEPLPERVVRGIVLARLANWLDGHGAVRPELAAAVASLLDGRTLPEVPLRGNGGSGEVLALGHLAAAMAASAGGTELKEPMELINGSPAAAALVADAAVAARRRLTLAHQVFALSAEAILAPLEAYGEPLEELWDDEHETAALRQLRRNLEGGATERRPYQAPVSYRILPRVLGQTHRAVARAEQAAETSLRSVSDNPVYIPPDADHPHGQAFSTGGYHNGMAYPALDELAGAWADLCQLAERQTERLLAVIEQGSYGGAMGGFYMVMTSWAEDARTAAQRTLIPLGGLGQNDTAAPTFFAWRKEREAGYCLEAALAILAALASDELERAGRPAPAALGDFLTEVRTQFPAGEERWARGEDAKRLHQAFTARVFDGDASRAQG
ncbi:MAG: aromatic amino acid ammonia-lyase [Actinobacteria bacterium]|nr:aromatic amino acid ammonia-lyase [Actinomycetota bacterium]